MVKPLFLFKLAGSTVAENTTGEMRGAGGDRKLKAHRVRSKPLYVQRVKGGF